MVKVFADLVIAGYYTTIPEKAVNGVKLVPENIRQEVKDNLVSRGYPIM